MSRRETRAMRTILATAFLTLAPALAFAHGDAPAPASAQGSAAIAEPAKTVDAFYGALAKGDGAAAWALLDDGVQIYEQGWVERSKAVYASEHLGSDTAFAGATTHTTTARSGFVAGDMATVISEGKTTGTFKDKPIDSVTLETMTLRRGPSGWRIVHIHWSSRAAKK